MRATNSVLPAVKKHSKPQKNLTSSPSTTKTAQNYKPYTMEKKKQQIKAIIEKAKKDGKPIDWATVVLC